MSTPRFRGHAATAALAVLLYPFAAGAHSILMSSSPAPGAAVAAGRRALELHFNSRVDQRHSRLTLVGPGYASTVLPIRQDGPPDALDAEADLAEGSYRVRWQALSVDGHITRGDVPFTVTGGGAAIVRAPAP